MHDEVDSLLITNNDISPIDVDGAGSAWGNLSDSAEVPFLTGWVKNLGLTQADRGVLIEGRCLTATHMSAASKLLCGQFPLQNGLIDTSILSNKQSYSSNPNSFVQIVFVSPNHWACVSNKFSTSGTVDLYDSMHTTPIQGDSIVLQVCKIMQSLKLSKLHIRVVNVSLQEGGTDCGLHAIAMAVDLCSDLDPFAIDYMTDEMRNHLCHCFEEGIILQFPSKIIQRESRVLRTVDIELYCVCRQPEHGQMACCDEFDTWYHPGCIFILENVLNDESDLVPWRCPSCEFIY